MQGALKISLFTCLNLPEPLGDPLANVFRGRQVKNIPDTTTLDEISRWIAHGEENPRSRPWPIPCRLIDVGGIPESRARLVQVDESTRERYAVLSYGWDLPTFELPAMTTGLASDSEIILEQLPKLFQDAIQVTHDLGLRYIWIDNLCTPQDTSRVWDKDSTNVASIYANAHVTLAASGAKSNLDGLFIPRQSRSYVSVPYTVGETRGSMLLLSLPVEKEFCGDSYVNLPTEPLSQSAWALQERALSQRVVHFASDQIYFEDRSGFLSEDCLVVERRHHTVEQQEVAIEGGNSLDQSARQATLKKAYRHRWQDLLWGYSILGLSNPAHKLPALANIARAMSSGLEDVYIVGLWRGSLVADLCWQPLRCHAVEGYRAPSWSWAALDGRLGTGALDNWPWDPVATILDARVEFLNRTNPFGQVVDAWLKVEAPLVPLQLSDATGCEPDSRIRLQTQKGGEKGGRAGFDTMDRSVGVSGDLVRGMQLFALVAVVIHRGDCVAGSCLFGDEYHCIIVTPVEGDDMGKVRRVGFMSMMADEFGPDEISESRRTFLFV